MHSYYSEDADKIDWQGIEDAAYEIGNFISRWGRISVSQCKEKFGTARVYCSFGFHTFHSLVWPRHLWIHKWWPYTFDLWISYKFQAKINQFFIPFQKWIYRQAYKKAVQKRPHLYEEIVSGADAGELFEGYIPGYKHNDYWKSA